MGAAAFAFVMILVAAGALLVVYFRAARRKPPMESTLQQPLLGDAAVNG
jgi:hypothetical protein